MIGPILAIAQLTWKASLRYRLFWLLATCMVSAVILLPLALRHDGTAFGFVQIVLTYTLSVVFVLLGLSTLWLSCGAMAREIEECQIQLIVTKPVARWQVWIGKWIGILGLNASLLLLAGSCIYGLTLWRLRSLPPLEQQRLREDFFVSRASVKPDQPDINKQLLAEFEKLPNRDALSDQDRQEVFTNLLQRILINEEVVGPGRQKTWFFDFGLDAHLRSSEDLYVRSRFYAATTNTSGLYSGVWGFAKPGETTREDTPVLRTAPDAYQELKIPGIKPDAQGRLVVMYFNLEPGSVLFPMDDGIEILYRDSHFSVNFLRALLVLLAWLSLLSIVGLAASSIASFPVAAFCSVGLLTVILCSGTLAESVATRTVLAGQPEDFQYVRPIVNALLLPLFEAILQIVKWVDIASPIDSLSTGRSITWMTVIGGWLRVVGLMGGTIATVGIVLLTRRELATASLQR